tara:strand:- start:180 stop:335 length:156 start_codon:yes stop_codon:yes gene_type:complete
MIRDMLDLLASDDWLINDKDVQTAKGAYEFPLTFNELKTSIKRRKLIRNGR